MKLNIRRLDQWNYVIEEVRVAKESGNEYTHPLGYYGNLDTLLTESIRSLPAGDNAKELLDSLFACQKSLLQAFYEACQIGQLDPVKTEMTDAAREGLKKARETKAAKGVGKSA